MSFCCTMNFQSEKRVHPLGSLNVDYIESLESHIQVEERKSGKFRLNFPFKLLEMCPHDILSTRHIIIYVKLSQLKSRVRTRCGCLIDSHQSTSDPAGTLHNAALRLSAELHWVCSQTSVGITCKCLGRSVEPELRLEV